jgi:16S rRNA (guanine966-N2)-methyltransferase|tara:strand:- start:1158 stop:1706 length:549 start_codon:yes stop_codon:yes gene_type:complete
LLIVTGGTAKGKRLKLPDKRITRPTAQIIRESLFGILSNFDFNINQVIDLYAGSGLLGIEALSRGADHCLFIESNRNVCKLIKKNLLSTGFIHKARVKNALIGKWQYERNNLSTLILADPPFNDETKWTSIEKSLGDLSQCDNVIFVIEHFHKDYAPKEISGLGLRINRRHGDSVISFYMQI